MWIQVIIAVLVSVLSLNAQQKEQPVGIVLSAQGARVLRAGNELPLKAQAGDMLFTGDSLQSDEGDVFFLFCPDKSSQTLAAGGKVVVESTQLRVLEGTFQTQTKVKYCLLPQLERSPSASQYHFGDTLTRAQEPSAAEQGSFETRVNSLPEDQRRALREELGPIDQELANNPQDQAVRLARAAVLQKYNLKTDAAKEFEQASTAWEGKESVRQLVHEAALADSPAKAEGPGQTYALLVGISKYQKLTDDQQLQFAHADAETFNQHLKSPRGGSIPPQNITLLTNEQATTAAIRTSIESFLKARAGKNDTVIVFIAAHGTVAETADGPGAFIVTHDSDPQDLASTGLPMADIQNLMREQLSKVGRVMIYIDVCRAGIIGTIKNNAVNRNVEALFEEEGELFGFLASRPKEFSLEGARFGGGHGAFTYFLLRGLNGDADLHDTANKDGIVSVNEVIEYVRDEVRDATRNQQHPVERVNFAGDPQLARVADEGILLAEIMPPSSETAITRAVQSAEQQVATTTAEDSDEELFENALAAGRLLPDEPDNAFEALRRLKQRQTPEEYLQMENRLRVALEDRGQQVLLRYLEGDQIPQTRADFVIGALHFRGAQELTPGSMLLEGRELFCEGRSLIFDKRYAEATDRLERAVRMEPDGAYSYNALGIAYLEQSNYSMAILAFRDAVRRAPYWAYPLHNLALAYTEAGDYRNAIQSYEMAIKLAPQFSYLPYNLGLVYQRLNRRKDAERAYRKAIELTPDMAEPHNALGVLYAAGRKEEQAEQQYRLAMGKNPELLAARHNLALLLAEKTGRAAEAIALLRENIAKAPDYVASRLVLAETLSAQGSSAEAMQEYRTVLEAKPDYVAARIALADLLAQNGDPDGALEQLRETLQRQPRNALAYEKVGDIEKARGNSSGAAEAYQKAMEYAPDQKTRKAIQKKMR